MEYAIIKLGGHQIWAEKEKPFIVNKLTLVSGSIILFNKVLLINKNNNLSFGYPYLDSSKVKGKVIQHLSGSKVLIYKMKSKKKYRRKKGHRQQITKLVLKSIEI